MLCFSGELYYWPRKRDVDYVEEKFVFSSVEFEETFPSKIRSKTLQDFNQLYKDFKEKFN